MFQSSWLAVPMLLIHIQVVSQANFKQQSKALKDTLLHYHLTGKHLDQHFSEQLFNDFIDEIDPDKILITKNESDKISIFNDYTIKTDEFDKIKKAYETNGNNKTKEQIDSYNQAVKMVNKAIESYNNEMQLLDKSRTNALTNWNMSAKAFFEAYIPKE